jgi:hypothetical protein
MQRPIPWLWILLLILVVLAPVPAGRFLLDLLGGITLLLILLPVFFGVAGFVAWQLLRRRLHTCSVCGFTSLDMTVCPACGTPFDPASAASAIGADRPAAARHPRDSAEIDASDVTIDVDVVEIDDQTS